MKKDGKKTSRILTFDLMRGYFLVAIILDHLNFFPNGLDWWSARGQLFVTTAEGFFFISGIVLGIVRGAKLINEPFSLVSKLLVKRGLQLYITSAVLVLLFTILGWVFFLHSPGLKVGILEPAGDIWSLLWHTLTFQYFYGWTDYLRLYAIFLFVSPLVMWLLRKGKWYIALAGSFAVWLLFPSDPTLPDTTKQLFQPLSWQLVFFGGLVVGFHWNDIVSWWRTRRAVVQKIAVSSLLAFASITVAFSALIAFGQYIPALERAGITSDLGYQLYIHYFVKEQLPLARIILFLSWFWATFYLFRRFESQIILRLGWLLLPFGTNSLYVYTLHGLAMFFIHMWLAPGNIVYNFAVSAGTVLIIRAMIHYRVLMNIIPR